MTSYHTTTTTTQGAYPKLKYKAVSRPTLAAFEDNTPTWTTLADAPSTHECLKEIGESVAGLGRSRERHRLGHANYAVHSALED